MVIGRENKMKRAIKAIASTQVHDYFGEFHTSVP